MSTPHDALAVPLPGPAPIAPAERIHVLDILRGFALFGMILVHFHQKMERSVTGPEDLIGWFVYVGLETKAWGVFAFLFGVGFAILLRRFEAKGVPVVATYLRRLFGLAIFGVIAWVCFGFQILLDYALWGAALLLIRNWSSAALLVAAVAVLMAMPVSGVLSRSLMSPAATTEAVEAPRTPAPAIQALRDAEEGTDYVALVRARAGAMRVSFLTPFHLLPGTTVALFILGLLALRAGVFDAPGRHVRLIVTGMAAGFVSWGLSWLVPLVLPDGAPPAAIMAASSGLGLFRDQMLCLTYAGALILLVHTRPAWLRRLAGFGLAGRMALTNYMLQIAALDVLGSAYGFGVRMRPLLTIPAALVLFGVLALFSRFWLARYRMGPAEWLWRTLTYLRFEPNRSPAGAGERFAVSRPS